MRQNVAKSNATYNKSLSCFASAEKFKNSEGKKSAHKTRRFYTLPRAENKILQKAIRKLQYAEQKQQKSPKIAKSPLLLRVFHSPPALKEIKLNPESALCRLLLVPWSARGTMVLSAEYFSWLAHASLKRAPGLNQCTAERRFRALYGVSPRVCATVWNLITSDLPPHASPKHLLWGLLFLKLYASENVHARIVGADEKTFRLWQWKMVKLIAALNVCRVSVDGTDFRICEPTPFCPSWYSHKFKGPGLRYEVALAIETGEIVWVHGPFQAGAFNDVAIFRVGLKKALE
eukprot:IDg6568t1